MSMTDCPARVEAVWRCFHPRRQRNVSLYTKELVRVYREAGEMTYHFSWEHIVSAADDFLQQALHGAQTPTHKMKTFDLEGWLSAPDPASSLIALHIYKASLGPADLPTRHKQQLTRLLLKAAKSLYERCSIEAEEQLRGCFAPGGWPIAMHSVLGSLTRSTARQTACQGELPTAAQVLAAGPAETVCLGLALSKDTTLPSLFLHVNIRQEPPILSAHITALTYLWQSLRGNTTLSCLNVHITGFSHLGHDTPLADQLFPRLMHGLSCLLRFNSTLRHIVIRGGGRHAPQRQEDLESLRKAAISAPFQKRFAIAGAFNRRSRRTALVKLPHHLMQRILDEAVPLAPCVIEFVKH